MYVAYDWYVWTDLDWSIPYLYTEHNNTPNFSGSLPVYCHQNISCM